MEKRDANKLTHDLRNHLAVAMIEAEMAGNKAAVEALETAAVTLAKLERVVKETLTVN